MDDPSRKRLLIADRLGQDHHHTGGSPRDQALFALLLVSFSLSLLTIFIFIWRASFFFSTSSSSFVVCSNGAPPPILQRRRRRRENEARNNPSWRVSCQRPKRKNKKKGERTFHLCSTQCVYTHTQREREREKTTSSPPGPVWSYCLLFGCTCDDDDDDDDEQHNYRNMQQKGTDGRTDRARHHFCIVLRFSEGRDRERS